MSHSDYDKLVTVEQGTIINYRNELAFFVQQYTPSETRKAEAPLFVSCEWLKQETEVNKDTLSLLDVTWFIEEEKNGREEYLK